MQLEGRFIYGSNYTFMVSCAYQGQIFRAVYKPVQGEQPLWDFPPHTLSHREVAAYLVSEVLGWELVPSTVFRTTESPLGPGSAQYFIEHNPDIHYFTLSAAKKRQLSKVMLFDLLINNADRKGGHVLIDPSGNMKLIDHGLCFHVEEKLRTVVWDYAGEPIPIGLLADVKELLGLLTLEGALRRTLSQHLTVEETTALKKRGEALLASGVFPHPPEDRRATPWPLV